MTALETTCMCKMFMVFENGGILVSVVISDDFYKREIKTWTHLTSSPIVTLSVGEVGKCWQRDEGVWK